MRCCVPFCRSIADNAAGTDGVTFHHFPSDATLRTKWLRALGKHDQIFKDSAVVCSQHFLDDDFCNVDGVLRQLRSGVIPSTVKLCIICLDTDRNVVSLSKYNLEDAYEKLTGHSICREGYLKQTLCIECAQRLTNFDKFRSKSLKARSAMMDLVKMHETVTIRHIKNINYIREELKSEIVKTAFAPDHCDLHIIECNYGNVKTEPGNIVLPDASHVVKIEKYDCTLDESDIGLKLEEPMDNIESRDPTACINNISDASILLDTKLMNEALGKERDLDEAIKVECSVYSDDDHNDHDDDAHHVECGSEECDTQLAYRTHMALHSQQRVTNQAWGGGSSTDYPHSSVKLKLLTTPLHEVASESKNTLEIIKNCIVSPEPECRTKSNLVSHMRIHTDEKPFSCKLCKYTCRSKYHLVSHMKIHTGEKPFSCKLCEYACRTKGELVIHMRIHTGEKPFSCKVCEYSCRKKVNLVSHMRIHTGEKRFSCKLCEYLCRRKVELVTHMRIHTGEKPFSCNLCEYAGRSKDHLVSHMRIHTGEKPFSCHVCQFACRKKVNLVSHMRIHTGEKPFSCKLCEYACRTKGDLVKHIRIHTGEKPFLCKVCEYACTSKPSLVSHMRIHTGEKPFSCKLCEYLCRRKVELVTHMRIHTGEKPFSCKLCEYAGRSKDHLVSHMRIHTGQKPFSCKLCEYACRTKGALVRHMRIHTGEKGAL